MLVTPLLLHFLGWLRHNCVLWPQGREHLHVWLEHNGNNFCFGTAGWRVVCGLTIHHSLGQNWWTTLLYTTGGGSIGATGNDYYFSVCLLKIDLKVNECCHIANNFKSVSSKLSLKWVLMVYTRTKHYCRPTPWNRSRPKAGVEKARVLHSETSRADSSLLWPVATPRAWRFGIQKVTNLKMNAQVLQRIEWFNVIFN